MLVIGALTHLTLVHSSCDLLVYKSPEWLVHALVEVKAFHFLLPTHLVEMFFEISLGVSVRAA